MAFAAWAWGPGWRGLGSEGLSRSFEAATLCSGPWLGAAVPYGLAVTSAPPYSHCTLS